MFVSGLVMAGEAQGKTPPIQSPIVHVVFSTKMDGILPMNTMDGEWLLFF